MPKHARALVIFRRDLRLVDNTALLTAEKEAKEIVLCFFLDPRQLEQNEYRSDHAVEFMEESLRELATEIAARKGKLYFFYGEVEKVLPKLIAELRPDGVYVNRDYTPFSLKRDEELEEICQAHKISFVCCGDALLQEPEQVAKNDGTPYVVFTPFFRKASQHPVRSPQASSGNSHFFSRKISLAQKLPSLTTPNPALYTHGGRKQALEILNNLETFQNYQQQRDYPGTRGTTGLSAHHKFGTVSIREVYQQITQKLGNNHPLVRQLYWRDFFTHIGYHFPHVFQGAFYQKYNALKWCEDEKLFQAWCEGKTGFPIVDAGMRQLNQTGYMHNRVRMIVASFLTKDLLISWRWGEKYFAQKLVDYDPCVNNGSWQWAASTGCDAQPYFRIFNPALQQKRFDPECRYIKCWVPEITKVPNHILHKLQAHQWLMQSNYPAPIVDHHQRKKMAQAMFQEAK